MKKIILVLFFLFPFISYADYKAFDINPIPPNTPFTSPNYAMYEPTTALDTAFGFEYTADSLVYDFDRVQFPFCRNLGTNIGELWLEIRSGTTTGPIIASSTMVINSGNVFNCTTTIGDVNATTSTMILNNKIQWLPGVKEYFLFRYHNTSGVSHFYFSVGTPGINGIALDTNLSPRPFGWSSKGYGLGSTPTSYTGTSTSAIICTTWDIGCYIAQSVVFLFKPDPELIDGLSSLTLASSTPFSYLYQMKGYINTIASGSPTSTLIKVPFMGTDIEIFDTSKIDTYVSSASTIKIWIGWIIWLLVLFVTYSEVMSIFHKKKENDT